MMDDSQSALERKLTNFFTDKLQLLEDKVTLLENSLNDLKNAVKKPNDEIVENPYYSV